MRRPAHLFVLGLLAAPLAAPLALGACAKDDGSGDGAGEGGTAGTTGGTTGGDTGDTGTTGEPGPDQGFDGTPATGITLNKVTWNQGVSVDIARDGGQVGAEGRVAPLIFGRRSIVRAFWLLDDGFEARELEGRLHLRYPDGRQVVKSYPLTVSGASDESDFANGGFGFIVEADEVEAGVEFQVSVWETDPGQAGQTDFNTATAGWELVGVEAAPLEIKAVVVPVDYTSTNGSCTTNTADPSQMSAEEFAEFQLWLGDHNPVQFAEVTLREEPIVRTGDITGPSNFFSILQGMRIDDGAGENVYYYALYDDCRGASGTLGAAPGAEAVTPTKEAAPGRVSAGRWFNDSAGPVAAPTSYSTFVHEVGHCQGRPHSPCGGPGNFPAAPDASYPYPDGSIGVWGLNVRTLQLYGPTSAFDYMGYCNPSWVSDYVWLRTFRQIGPLTSWDYEYSVPEGVPGHVLQGLIYTNGDQEWWTAPGKLGGEPTGDTVTFDGVDGTQLALPAHIHELEDEPGTRYVVVNLPHGIDHLDAAESLALRTKEGELFEPLPTELNYELSR